MNTILGYSIAFLMTFISAETLASSLPNDAYGVVYIHSVKTGSLPFLHGLKGEGHYLTTNAQGKLCRVEPIVLIGGGFSGERIDMSEGQPIVLTVYNPVISERLKQGQKTHSVDYAVSMGQDARQDIYLDQGLTLNDNFILHPRKAWSNWFGVKPTPPTCHIVEADDLSL